MDPHGGGDAWKERRPQLVEEEIGIRQDWKARTGEGRFGMEGKFGMTSHFRRVGPLMGYDNCLESWVITNIPCSTQRLAQPHNRQRGVVKEATNRTG